MACKRCGAAAAVETRREAFCGACFVEFVETKFRRQLAAPQYRVQYAKGGVAPPPPPLVMVAVLGGVALVLMLEMVARYLAWQQGMHKGRQGFRVVAVHVVERGTADPLERLRARFPHVEWVRVEAGLPEAAAAASRTDCEDVWRIRRHRRVLDEAVVRGCRAVVYGHTMSRLALEVVGLAARGRGSEIAGAVADGAVEHRGTVLEVMHPLRELLESEVGQYAALCELELVVESAPAPATSRVSTIDYITRDYFRSVEQEYGLVVSAVVRTADKMAPATTAAAACPVCHQPVLDDAAEWLNHRSVGTVVPPSPLCYGCTVTASRLPVSLELVLAELSLE